MTPKWPALSLLAVALCGCGSQVIPTAVVEGTTATIAIPGQFEVGYGRAWAGNPDTNPTATPPAFNASNPLEDLQRGEMKFTLVHKTAFTEVKRIPVRLITRVAVDAASNRAYNYSGTRGYTQVIALLDIPPDLVPEAQLGQPQPNSTEYWIKVERWRRNPSGVFQPIAQTSPTGASSWYGWGTVDGGSGEQMIPITIVDAPGTTGAELTHYTPIEGWDANNQRVQKDPFILSDIESTVPLPEFRIQLPASVRQPPYAWELEMTYPATRMTIFGVRALRGDPSGAIVMWKATPGAPPADPCSPTIPGNGTLKIQVVDPDPKYQEHDLSRRARGVAVVFALSSCGTRIAAGQVSVASIKGYDINGAPLSPTPSFAVVDQDLN